MGSWDDEEDDDVGTGAGVINVQTRGKFDDEEDDEGVLDSWDAPEEDEKPAVAQVSKKKGTIKEALKKREEAEAAEELAQAERRRNAEPEETPEERRQRQRARELESDLNNAADLFGAAHITDADKTLLKAHVKGATLSDLLDPKPATKEDFATLATKVSEGLTTLGKELHYVDFLQKLVTALCDPISAEDTKKIQTSLNVLVNAKNLAERGGPAKKKKAANKPALPKMGAQTGAYTRSLDTNRLDDDYDEYVVFDSVPRFHED